MAAIRDRAELEDEANNAAEAVDRGDPLFPGMSYADGVDAALRWALGNTNDRPTSDE